MSNSVILGIDPGVTGCVAGIGDFGIVLDDTPTYKDGKRTRIDVVECVRTLIGYSDISGVTAFVEKVQPMPVNGSIACFSLGYSFGVWQGILASLRIPYQLVTPQAWKKSMMPGEPKEKDASRIVALRMFPELGSSLNLVKHHNRADALLIAEYGRRMTR